MAYNLQVIQMMRGRKDQTARQAFRNKNFTNTPFVQPADLMDGDYLIRLWPEDPKKLPLGYLYYKVHTLECETENAVKKIQCPRSSNWDPFPEYFVDSNGIQVPAGFENLEEHSPVYKVRCWPCEITDYIAAEGLAESFSDSIVKRVLPNLYNSAGWQDHYFFPCTIQMEIGVRTKRTLDNGKQVEDIEYRPSPGKNMHVILKLREDASLRGVIFEMMGQCPDLNNLTTGRWLTLRKQGGGKGPSGYQVYLGPYPSAAGFELKDTDYQNFQGWGAGSPRKPTQRFTYEEVEAIAGFRGNPHTNPPTPPGLWWGDEVRAAGVPLTDAEAELLDAAPF